LSSSRSRRNRHGGFQPARRDAALVAGGLVVLAAASLVIAQEHRAAGSEGDAAAARPAASATSIQVFTDATAGTVKASGSNPAAAKDGVDQVARPWRPGQPELGIDVYWAVDPGESAGTVAAKIRATVDDVVGYGANWISISFPYATTGVTSDELFADPSMTPTVTELGALITVAKQAGLHVGLRPLLDGTALQLDDPKAWRGTIAPADVSAWFASYGRFLTPYAQLAQRLDVDAFYVSTELTSMEQYTSDWSGITRKLASIYTGRLVASVNYDRLPVGTPRIPGTSLSVDAYSPIPSAGPDASVAQLVDGWNQWLDQYPASGLDDLQFAEVGIVPQDGAYQAPYTWNASAGTDPAIQVNWYTAACQVAQTRHVEGIYWWYLNLENTSGQALDSDPMDILNAPGAKEIAECFATYPR
jgi:hypothetical protein